MAKKHPTTARKILQAKGASKVVGQATAYGKPCRFLQPLSEEEVESLNGLLAAQNFTDSDLEKVVEGEGLCITFQWEGEIRLLSIDPVIVSQAQP